MKLVRDKKPEMLKKQGKEVVFRTATDEEFLPLLKVKLREEVAEYLHEDELEELIDALELIHTIAKESGVSPEELEQKRKKRREEMGGFDKRIVLEKW